MVVVVEVGLDVHEWAGLAIGFNFLRVQVPVGQEAGANEALNLRDDVAHAAGQLNKIKMIFSEFWQPHQLLSLIRRKKEILKPNFFSNIKVTLTNSTFHVYFLARVASKAVM